MWCNRITTPYITINSIETKCALFVFKEKGKRVCFALAHISQAKCWLETCKVFGIHEVEGWPSRWCQIMELRMFWEWKAEAEKGL
jgi:hypothetical protein